MANEIKDYIDKKNPVTVGIVAVLVVAFVAAIFGAGVSGYASYTAVEFSSYADINSNTAKPILPIVVSEFAHEGWGDCDPTTMDTTKAGFICTQLGFSGLAENQPCEHTWSPTRYFWDGTIPFEGNENLYIKTTAGYALTGVRCVA